MCLGHCRLFFQYHVEPPEEIEIPVCGLHERCSTLRVEIRRDYTAIAVDALAIVVRFDLGEAFPSRGKDVTAEGVKAADERAVGMDAATPRIEEDAGAVFFPIQNGSAVVGVASHELGSGQAPVRGQAHDFVGVDLDFLVVAAT